MMVGLQVSSNLQCEQNRQEGACLESNQPICRFESTFIDTYQASKTIYKVWPLKSRMKIRSVFEDIITSRNEVFRDFVSDIPVGNITLGNSIWVTVKGYVIVR
jgi:hypothetical protein